jgi:hypothetical protein
MALLVNRLWILGVIATGLVSIKVAFTGFCPAGSVLRLLGFTPMLGADKSTRCEPILHADRRWYLERRIYLAVGINISVASLLTLTYSGWFMSFTAFVGGAMVWFAATGFCVMANGLYWLGAEPRLTPETMPSGRCEECAMSGVCIGAHAKQARPGDSRFMEPPARPLINDSYPLRTLP